MKTPTCQGSSEALKDQVGPGTLGALGAPPCEMPDVIPRDRAKPRQLLADLAGYSSDWPGSIPRISHDQRHATASSGIRLHDQETNQGRRSAPELGFPLVAGVGFEAT